MKKITLSVTALLTFVASAQTHTMTGYAGAPSVIQSQVGHMPHQGTVYYQMDSTFNEIPPQPNTLPTDIDSFAEEQTTGDVTVILTGYNASGTCLSSPVLGIVHLTQYGLPVGINIDSASDYCAKNTGSISAKSGTVNVSSYLTIFSWNTMTDPNAPISAQYVLKPETCTASIADVDFGLIRRNQMINDTMTISGSKGTLTISGPDINEQGILSLGGAPQLTVTPGAGIKTTGQHNWVISLPESSPTLTLQSQSGSTLGAHKTDLTATLTCE